MNDFQKALAELHAADLSFLAPAKTAIAKEQATPRPGKARRKPRATSDGSNNKVEENAALAAPTSSAVDPVAPPIANAGASSRPFPTAEPVLPVFVPPAKRTPKIVLVDVGGGPAVTTGATAATTAGAAVAVATDAAADTDVAASNPPARKRNRLAHDWPPVGAKLAGEYFGVTYRAEVVAARKKLKSGKQIRLLDGPGQGKRLDSFSKAALVATARQRRADKLGRKGMSSGWEFWVVTEPAAS